MGKCCRTGRTCVNAPQAVGRRNFMSNYKRSFLRPITLLLASAKQIFTVTCRVFSGRMTTPNPTPMPIYNQTNNGKYKSRGYSTCVGKQRWSTPNYKITDGRFIESNKHSNLKLLHFSCKPYITRALSRFFWVGVTLKLHITYV